MDRRTKKIFEKEIQKEMCWIGTVLLSFVIFFVLTFSFAILLVGNEVIADRNIDNFKNSFFVNKDE
tara:strand:+ start:1615 stop:1812 length:198 start_codon:yes stop_codon:yes gene_type:complete